MTGRLIDADELFVKWQTTLMKIGEPVSVLYILAAMSDLQQAPTVEAIPVQWLENFRDGLDMLSESRLMHAIDLIIDAYRVEKKRKEE